MTNKRFNELQYPDLDNKTFTSTMILSMFSFYKLPNAKTPLMFANTRYHSPTTIDIHHERSL